MSHKHDFKKNKNEKKCDISTDLSSCYNNFYPLLESKLNQTENIKIGFVEEISKALEAININDEDDELQNNETNQYQVSKKKVIPVERKIYKKKKIQKKLIMN